MRILVTGSRNWTDRGAIADALIAVLTKVPSVTATLVHGGARGADQIAHNEWMKLRKVFPTLTLPEIHKADWSAGVRAGPRRNAQMVASGIDICLAFPLGESKGTRDCMKRATAAGVEVRVFGDG